MKSAKYLDGLEKPHEEKIYKYFTSELKVADETKRTLIVTISTPNEDRSGDTMSMKGMEYSSFIKNPVVLFAHNYGSKPIAKCLSLQVTDRAVVATVEFTPKGLYEEADIIYELYKGGFLSAWSIGFRALDYDVNKTGGYDFKSWELFEFSSVPVPDNPEALTIMRSKGINVDKILEKQTEVVEKGAIGYKETPKAPKDEAWDGSAEVKAATVDDLKVMCAWVDSENADNKSAYKLPHHKAEGDHAVVWNGVKAAGDAVQGARNKLDVPEGDLAGIKAHLAKHYKEFDETPPWEDDSKDDGKKIDEEVVETKDNSDKEVNPEAKEAEKPAEPEYTPETKITELTLSQLKSFLDTDIEVKEAHQVVKKDVDEVIALGYVLDTLSWFISCFEYNEVSQSSIDKLTQALGLVMQVVAEQAVLGEKSFKLSDFPNTKETVKLLAKAGRAISAASKEKIQKAMGCMDEAKGHMQELMDSAEDTSTNTDGDKPEEEKAIEPSLVKKLLKQADTTQTQLKETDKNVGYMLLLLKQAKKKGGEIQK